MVIMLIDIPIVHDLGMTSCLGVLLMIVTNKIMLPVILSHLRLEPKALGRPDGITGLHSRWWAISVLAEPRPALITLLVSLVLLVGGTITSRHLLTGDIGAGATELRADSRYNLDNSRLIHDYTIGMDVLSVYAETSNLSEACLNWPVMNAIERFDQTMSGVDGVRSCLLYTSRCV